MRLNTKEEVVMDNTKETSWQWVCQECGKKFPELPKPNTEILYYAASVIAWCPVCKKDTRQIA